MSAIINKKSCYIFALLFLFGGGFFVVAKTNAYFMSEQNSSGNTFSAGTLSVSLNNSTTFLSGVLYPGDSAHTSIAISNTGSLDSKYIVASTLAGLNTAACDHVTMTATNGVDSYTGLIKNFISTTTITTNATWNFSFAINLDASPSVWGKTCFFKWTFTAWQNDLLNSSSGFINIKEKLGSIQIGKPVVMNEFITNPGGGDDAPMPGGEWVELFNNSNNTLDVSGLVLYDNNDLNKLFITTSNTNTHGTTISPHGFLVVYRNGDTNFNLNDDTDSVRLATGFPITSSTILDSFAYTIEKPEGFSFARFPDGVGEWIDPVPTPGEPNGSEQIVDNIDEATIANVEAILVEPVVAEESKTE